MTADSITADSITADSTAVSSVPKATTESAEDDVKKSATPGRPAIQLVPRLKGQGYEPEQIDRRRRWVESKAGVEMPLVGRHALRDENLRGNIENPVGAVQMPLAVAGPLRVRGEHADDTFYVPMATTEGALVRSYERGMVALTRAGGAEARVLQDENRVSPIFHCPTVAAAAELCARAEALLPELRRAAESTTSHGRLLRVTPLISGRKVILDCSFSTGDAHGMNMIVNATDAACRELMSHLRESDSLSAVRYHIFSGYNGEKRATGSSLRGGKGKKVTAGAFLPGELLQAVLHVDADELVEMWHATVVGHLHTGALGYNGHYANGLTALFIATGQDVANVANSAVGVTQFEATDGGLYASVTLPSLTVATVGGGTGLGTSRECLRLLGCFGSDKALKFAEITAALILAGELSMAGAVASGEFVAAHETYGRNRPNSADGDP